MVIIMHAKVSSIEIKLSSCVYAIFISILRGKLRQGYTRTKRYSNSYLELKSFMAFCSAFAESSGSETQEHLAFI